MNFYSVKFILNQLKGKINIIFRMINKLTIKMKNKFYKNRYNKHEIDTIYVRTEEIIKRLRE